MNIRVCVSSSVCDPGWVSQWVYGLHLDIYVSKCDNIGPPCGELCLLWIVACLPHRVGATCLSPNCGMQPNHLETLTLPETAGFTRAWHSGWWDCKILKWHMQMFGNSRGAVRKNQKSCCGNAEQDWSVERTGTDFLTELQTQKLYVKKKKCEIVENEVRMETSKLCSPCCVLLCRHLIALLLALADFRLANASSQ